LSKRFLTEQLQRQNWSRHTSKCQM